MNLLLHLQVLSFFFIIFTIIIPKCNQSHASPSPTESDASVREDLPSNQWYTKYESYPEYCSTPSQLQQRTIPPLQHTQKQDDNDNDDGTDDNDNTQLKIQSKILHVTAIIRHGTRTPSKPHPCWSDFWSPNSDTAYWNCELTTMIAPPGRKSITKCKNNPSSCDNSDYRMDESLDGDGIMFLFDKRYNALEQSMSSLSSKLKNELNGTCQLGQLLLRGYEQELHNGKMLRRTYVRNKSGENDDDNDDDESKNIDESMILFDLKNGTYDTDGKRPYEEPHLYYRADDDQRTLMSGQVLLRGLFGDLLWKHSQQLGSHSDPTIILHTADISRDILSPDGDICPRLKEIEDEVKKSEEYKKIFENSAESKILNQLMEKELGGNFHKSAKVCA